MRWHGVNEFALIETHFKRLAMENVTVAVDLGIGDDCALVSVPQGKQLAISTDTLVQGVHFPETTSAFDVGYKALAVNLSDLAAMGAEPAWFTLCLTLPDPATTWIADFCQGLSALIRDFPVRLIGGDTTRGPLTVSIQVMGLVDKNRSLLRGAARVGDDIWVSGYLGGAGVGLKLLEKNVIADTDDLHDAIQRLNRPRPRINLGRGLLGLASACIDVSDGLLADLGHILHQSQVGAMLDIESIPIAPALHNLEGLRAIGFEPVELEQARFFALSWGDDYELCFTAKANQRDDIQRLSELLKVPISRIGQVVAQPGLFDISAPDTPLEAAGFTHF